MILKKIVEAIERSPLTRYQIAKDCGIDHTVMHRIYYGGSCSMQTAETLCEYLGLELVHKKPKKRKVGR